MLSYYDQWDDVDRIPQQHISEQPVKSARKRHLCSGCLKYIEIGQGYMREFWLIDGQPTSIERHHGCWVY